MASAFHLVVLLGLSSGLWLEAIAKCPKKERRMLMEKEKRERYDRLMKDCCFACKDGWVPLNSRCFKFIHEERDWYDAEADCIRQGGNLASMHGPKDYLAFRELVKTSTGKNKQTWLGGYDAVKEGCWRWSDGTPFDYVKWGPKEPNNFNKKEHCMELNYAEKDHLNDWFCYIKRSYICGREMEIKN